MVKSLRASCIELLTEIEARLDFEDEMPPLDVELVMKKVNAMARDVEDALGTAHYDKFLQSGLQVLRSDCFMLYLIKKWEKNLLSILNMVYHFNKDVTPLVHI